MTNPTDDQNLGVQQPAGGSTQGEPASMPPVAEPPAEAPAAPTEPSATEPAATEPVVGTGDASGAGSDSGTTPPPAAGI